MQLASELVQKLGIAQGLHYLGDANECPFCGESVSGSWLVTHYRGYFSQSYAAHKERIQQMRGRLVAEFSGDRLAALQRVLQEERNKREFWTRYFDPPAFRLDLDRLATGLERPPKQSRRRA